MTPLAITAPAEADILHHEIETAERFGMTQAERLVDAFGQAWQSLSRFPQTGHHRKDLAGFDRDLRFLTVSKRFVVVYEITPEGVRILRVFHGSQDIKAELEIDFP